MSSSSDHESGSSLCPGSPVPALCPPPVASPSRMWRRRAGLLRSTSSSCPLAARDQSTFPLILDNPIQESNKAKYVLEPTNAARNSQLCPGSGLHYDGNGIVDIFVMGSVRRVNLVES